MVVMVTKVFIYIKTHDVTLMRHSSVIPLMYLHDTVPYPVFFSYYYYELLFHSAVVHSHERSISSSIPHPFSLTTTTPVVDTAGQKLSGRCQGDLSPKFTSSVYLVWPERHMVTG